MVVRVLRGVWAWVFHRIQAKCDLNFGRAYTCEMHDTRAGEGGMLVQEGAGSSGAGANSYRANSHIENPGPRPRSHHNSAPAPHLGLQHDAGKLGLVDGVGEALSLQAQPRVLAVPHAALAHRGAIEEIASWGGGGVWGVGGRERERGESAAV